MIEISRKGAKKAKYAKIGAKALRALPSLRLCVKFPNNKDIFQSAIKK
jgi:hypothetical protein